MTLAPTCREAMDAARATVAIEARDSVVEIIGSMEMGKVWKVAIAGQYAWIRKEKRNAAETIRPFVPCAKRENWEISAAREETLSISHLRVVRDWA